MKIKSPRCCVEAQINIVNNDVSRFLKIAHTLFHYIFFPSIHIFFQKTIHYDVTAKHWELEFR